jgi:hypothetical protein
LALGYQLIQTERDASSLSSSSSTTTPSSNSSSSSSGRTGLYYSGLGHAGVGGSIGFWHRPTGLCVGLTLNKADGGQDVTLELLRVIGDYYHI